MGSEMCIRDRFIENDEIELKARTGESTSSDIADTKTILDFFKNK